jgi:hypothetical protein
MTTTFQMFRRLIVSFILLFLLTPLPAQQYIGSQDLPEYAPGTTTDKDWLVEKIAIQPAIYRLGSDRIVFSNGILSRTFSISPDGCSVGLDLLKGNVPFLRAVKPEAMIVIDGITIPVGGLLNQPVLNYFRNEWLQSMKKDPGAMHLTGYSLQDIKKRFEWKKRSEWISADLPWPPPGKELIMTYTFGQDRQDQLFKIYGKEFTGIIMNLVVEVHYELYEGLPLMSKWIAIRNSSPEPVRLDHFTSEILAFVEPESSVGDLVNWATPNLTIETDYAFGGGMTQDSGLNKSYFWEKDTAYQSIINYNRVQPTMLQVKPALGPGLEIEPGGIFESYRVFEMLHDGNDRERRGLQVRRMYRTIAPWAFENPVLMHVRNADEASVKLAVDQCADAGFEMVIMTFGSGFNIEDSSGENLEKMKHMADYAHAKGIALGGYSLLASRSISTEDDVVMPEGRQPTFGKSPCLQSKWGIRYFNNLYLFYEKTGLDVLEHDGSYPGDVCMSADHPGHTGLQDSQWRQFQQIRDFYRWCRGKGIYLNVPDWYFLNGSSKIAMGYRETNWSLPREFQEIIERQNIYDGTWEKSPSMGWMFVPLVQYHGGGEAATIEPLKDHLNHYEQRLANLFGAGVQACYRGPRLYDAPETREIVIKWVDFYKKHRKILDADVIHVRRPDGRDYDGLLHVDPWGEEKGLLMLYSPLDEEIRKTITLDLYYTGLKGSVRVIHEAGKEVEKYLDHQQRLDLDIRIPAGKWTWYVFK